MGGINKKILFEVEGLKVHKDEIYTIQHRPDKNAPSGFQKYGATKLPSAGIEEVFYCRWIGPSKDEGVWDSGFYKHSPMYTGMDEAEVEKIVKRRVENVLEPFRVSIGNPQAFNQQGEHIAKTKFKIYEGQSLNTNNPRDLMTLYFALIKRKVVVEANEGDSTYDSAPYRISDINKKISNQERKAKDDMDVVFAFKYLQKNNPELLGKVFRYIGINIDPKATEGAQALAFKRFLSKNDNNSELFMRVAEMVEKERGLERVEIFCILKDMELKKDSGLEKAASGYILKGEDVGTSLKVAAEMIATKKELSDIKKDLLLADD